MQVTYKHSSRPIVDIEAIHGYESFQILKHKRMILDNKLIRHCEKCKIKLSIYNDSNFCAQHERFTRSISNSIRD